MNDDNGKRKMSLRTQSAHSVDQKKFPSQLQCTGVLVFTLVIVALCSGVVLGWPSLRRQLVSAEESSLSEQALGSIFTVGSWSTQAGRFFYGVTRDRWLGTKWTTAVAMILCLAGAIGTAFCSPDNGSALAISMFFMGLGSGTQLCLQPVAVMFDPSIQGSILQTHAGAFQISGLVFVILTSVTSNRKKAFLAYAGLVVIFLVCAIILLPSGDFPNRKAFLLAQQEEQDPRDCEHDMEAKPESKDMKGESRPTTCESKVLIDETDESNEGNEAKLETVSVDTSRADGPLLLDQLKSAEYIMLVLWFAAVLIPLNYYVGSIGFQLEELGDDDGKYTRILIIIYSASALIAPISGKLSDVAGVGVTQNIATSFAAASLFFLSAPNIPLPVHTIGMTLYGMGRMMVFGSFFANVGKRFGYTHYGTLSGLGLLISGVASLLQYPLIVVATEGSTSIVNICCGIFLLAWLPYGVWLSRREWKV